MSKCRYNLLMDCNSKDCVICVLDSIKTEIIIKYGNCDICEYFEDYDYEENDISEYRSIGNIADVLHIIDKYKAESEGS